MKPFLGSRHMSLSILFDPEELKNILEKHAINCLFPLGIVTEFPEVSLDCFIDEYRQNYSTGISGSFPLQKKVYGIPFGKGALERVDLKNEKILWRQLRPVVQIMPFGFAFSKDGKLMTKMISGDLFFWGLSFSYPTLFSSGKEPSLQSISTSPLEHQMFLQFFRSLRQASSPVFIKKGDTVYKEGFRIGKAPSIFHQKVEYGIC